MRTVFLAALLTLPALSGCLVAGVVGGVVASQELLDNNSYVSRVNVDVRRVWPEVKQFMSEASLDVIEVDDEMRVARAKIDGGLVTVGVEAYDIDQTILRVSAKNRFGVNDGESAEIIMSRIHDRLDRR